MIRYFLMSSPGTDAEGGGSNTMALVSAISGALAIVGTGCCCVPIVSCFAQLIVPVLALVAIVTGILGMSKANELGGTGKGMAMAGIGMGVGAFLLGIVAVVVGMFLGAGMGALQGILENM
jgi:hypothetical protein